MRRWLAHFTVAAVLVAFVATLAACATSQAPYVPPPGTPEWTRQYGTDSVETAAALSADAGGNVYVAGSTGGGLAGANAGLHDAYVRSYDSEGGHRWTRQFGTSADDSANAVVTDSGGNVYVAGSTSGAIEGSNAGSSDVYVRSFDSHGDLRWTRQFGTSASDSGLAVASSGDGHIYVAGKTQGAFVGSNAGFHDVFVRSYASNGDLRWTRQFGTSFEDVGTALAIDGAGNVYVAGWTQGALEGTNSGLPDPFVRSYDSNGNLRWTRQFGTSGDDRAEAITTDASGVYLAGGTSGVLGDGNAGGTDAYIRSFDVQGTIRWTRQFGTSSLDFASGIASDGDGNILISGQTWGALEGSSAGGTDAFVRSYSNAGDYRWTRQFGTVDGEVDVGITARVGGHVYVGGSTSGDLEGVNAGSLDAFVRRYTP